MTIAHSEPMIRVCEKRSQRAENTELRLAVCDGVCAVWFGGHQSLGAEKTVGEDVEREVGSVADLVPSCGQQCSRLHWRPHSPEIPWYAIVETALPGQPMYPRMQRPLVNITATAGCEIAR